MHVCGAEMVHDTGGLDGDSKCPALSFGPTLTAAICSQLEEPPSAPEIKPRGVIVAVRCGGSSDVVLDELAQPRSAIAGTTAAVAKKSRFNGERRKQVS